jgi:hypothetical protein
MSDTATKNFLGIPVEGDISLSSRQSVVQKTQDELAPILLAVLADPIIVAVGWYQYTPYFNDGDACEFSAAAPHFVCVGDNGSVQEYEDDPYEWEENRSVDYGKHPILGGREFTWEGTWQDGNRTRVAGAYEGEHEASYNRARALSDAIEGGAFNDVLLAAFGDHAKISVNRDGITVDSYEHD